MNIAVIDLGTNTFNILIKDRETGAIVFTDKLSVRLGDGGINENRIAPAPFRRGIDALKQHLETCRKWEAKEVYAFATSAVRSASNQQEFVEALKEQTGIVVNVIDGDKEAELIYLGVKQALEPPPGRFLIMDIGGGSTELIIADEQGILWKKSFLLGASRIMEKFRPSDPITDPETEQLEDYFEQELTELFAASKQFPVNTMIGSSGTFDTLAAMVAHRFHTPEILEGQTTYTFDMYEYMTISRLMLRSGFEERLVTPGMIPMRADLIVIACIQINFILKRLAIKGLKRSAYSLKEGVFSTLENTDNPWQRSLL